MLDAIKGSARRSMLKKPEERPEPKREAEKGKGKGEGGGADEPGDLMGDLMKQLTRRRSTVLGRQPNMPAVREAKPNALAEASEIADGGDEAPTSEADRILGLKVSQRPTQACVRACECVHRPAINHKTV